MSIKNKLQNIKLNLPKNITLVAVSKTKPVELLNEAYDQGQRIFGENKVQEMVDKFEKMPKDIKWHMIGHLQTNKVKYIASFVSLIHGVDSLKLLREINKQATKHNRVIDCLIQIKIATEDTKFGMSLNDLQLLLKSDEFKTLDNIRIKGLMGMASFTTDNHQIESEFKYLKSIFDQIKKKYSDIEILSMGMSNDYKLATKYGSNMIRIGSHIFGSR
ncbi:MAG: YggS family pyridoxal phosphate-dependent enzyme [Flavobacteriaceae bacterium]